MSDSKKYFIEADCDEDGWNDEGEYVNVFVVENDGSKTLVGGIGGEPEDNTYYRTYSWVEGALNDAYERGLRDAK